MEFFVKDAFCNSFDYSLEEKERRHRNYFSYLGNQNNPPDIIIKNSDAIEVKKINALRFNDLALNSSYPKSMLLSDSPMITTACRACESTSWTKKDMIYAIGFIEKNDLRLLTLVYGDCYAASPEIYERVKNAITGGLQNTDLEFSKTKELGRVNRVDPLGITNLRVRGMWTIQNPMKVFSEVLNYEPNLNKFDLFALMRESKYNSLPESDRNLIENDQDISVENNEIKNPDNPAKLLKTKLIKYSN